MMRATLLFLVTVLGAAMLTGACRDASRPFMDSLPAVNGAKSSSPPPLFQKGMSYATWSSDGYGTSKSDGLLEELKSTGTEWVSIVVTWYQKNKNSTVIYRVDDGDSETATDKALAHVVKRAHDLGMKVMLKPTVDLVDGGWRGDISFGNDEKKWRDWFASYRDFIVYYAKLAQGWGVEQFCVGVEYQGTAHRKTDWQNIIREVKTHYSGYLTYAANYNEYQTVKWWDDLDFVGIDAYFTLTSKKDPTIEELMNGWRKKAKEIETWQSQVRKPIIFTEVGYLSSDGTNRAPWDWEHPDSLDLAEQADCYKATFETLWGKPWLAGMYWWLWSPDFEGGSNDKSYVPRGKPAERILKEYYRRLYP